MGELDRFETRLAASLERLAEETPTAFEPDAVAATAIRSARRRWAWPGSVQGGLRFAAAVRIALVVVAVLALVLGMIALGNRVTRPPLDGVLTGDVACAGAAGWPASAAGPVELECAITTPDPRLTGALRIRLGERAPLGDGHVREGSIEVSGDGMSWSGPVLVRSAPHGLAVAEASLVGADGGGGPVRLRLLSDDGVTWGALARTGVER